MVGHINQSGQDEVRVCVEPEFMASLRKRNFLTSQAVSSDHSRPVARKKSLLKRNRKTSDMNIRSR